MTADNTHGPRKFSYTSAVYAMPDAAFALLRDLIVQRTGVLFDDAKRGLLADKLSELVASNGLTSFLDYYYMLRYDENDAHWSALMDRLAVPETFFWRQSEQLLALSRVIAPQHFASYPGRPLRIWSAACCTGEEPISIAMALDDAGFLGTHPIEIRATDGSPAMIARATAGLYGERSFRQLPEVSRLKHFDLMSDGRWRPHANLTAPIRWGIVNLADSDAVRPLAASDVIFCRNVFIYFSDDAIRRVTQTFAEFMSPDGYLFLGASESLTRLGIDLELAEIAGGFAYVKLGRRPTVESGASGTWSER